MSIALQYFVQSIISSSGKFINLGHLTFEKNMTFRCKIITSKKKILGRQKVPHSPLFY